jgi:hypothetical protein
MHPQSIFPFFFIAFLTLVVGSFVYKIIRNGGFKGAMFGAPIKKTEGEVEGTNSSRIMSVSVRVHALGGDSPNKAIGLEFVAKSFASYQMMPVVLSKSEARKLIALLEAVSRDN